MNEEEEVVISKAENKDSTRKQSLKFDNGQKISKEKAQLEKTEEKKRETETGPITEQSKIPKENNKLKKKEVKNLVTQIKGKDKEKDKEKEEEKAKAILEERIKEGVEKAVKKEIENKSLGLSTLLNNFLGDILSKEQINIVQEVIASLLKGAAPLENLLSKKEEFIKSEQNKIVTPEVIVRQKNVESKQQSKEEKAQTSTKKKKKKKEHSNQEDLGSDNEEQPDNAAITLEDPKIELPKKLMAAMNSMSDKLSCLETDQYGEWLLDITKDDDLVHRIIKNGHLLTLLLRHLYKNKSDKETEKDIKLFDITTQTETIFDAELLKNTFGEGPRTFQGKTLVNKKTQTDGRDFLNTKRPTTPRATRSTKKMYVYNEKNQLHSTLYTITQPFNIGIVPQPIQTEHPSNAFLKIFIEKLDQRDRKYLNVMPLSLKQLLRTINQLYSEKMNANKETISIRLQGLAAFVYDSYINKYGLLNVAERKMKEMFLSTSFNQKKIEKIELFSRFLGLNEIKYTSDDLQFMFSVAILVIQKLYNASYVKREAAVFELVETINVKDTQAIVDALFRDKIKRGLIDDINVKVLQNVKESEEGSSIKEIIVDSFYRILIDVYRSIKTEIQEQFVKHQVTLGDVLYSEDYYGYNDFMKIIKELQWVEQESPDSFFNRWSIFVKDPKEYEAEKKMCLEMLISHIFRCQITFQTIL